MSFQDLASPYVSAAETAHATNGQATFQAHLARVLAHFVTAGIILGATFLIQAFIQSNHTPESLFAVPCMIGAAFQTSIAENQEGNISPVVSCAGAIHSTGIASTIEFGAGAAGAGAGAVGAGAVGAGVVGAGVPAQNLLASSFPASIASEIHFCICSGVKLVFLA